MNTILKKIPQKNVSSKGFSLIELIVAMVVIGVLAAVAVPKYNEYVCRSRRGQAETLIASVSTSLVKYFSMNKSYTDINVDKLKSFGLEKTPSYNSSDKTIGNEGQRYGLTVTGKNNDFCIQMESKKSGLICGPRNNGSIVMRYDSKEMSVKFCKCGLSLDECNNFIKKQF